MCLPFGAPRAQSDDYVVIQSPHDFDTTLQRVVAFLEGRQQVVVETTDKQAQVREHLGSLDPLVVVTFMRPSWRRTLLQYEPHMALHMPFRFVVMEELAGEIFVLYEPAAVLKRRYGIGDSEPVIQILAALQREAINQVMAQ